MSDFKNRWVVEYSVKGKAVHIHTVGEMLEANLRNVMEGMSNDYIPVLIADSPEAANQQADTLEAELKKRQK